MSSDSDIATWAARIDSEYRELPGLLLTRPQMQRLWGLDNRTCEIVVAELVSRRVLVKTSDGSYARAGRQVSSSWTTPYSKEEQLAMDTRKFRPSPRTLRRAVAAFAVVLIIAATGWYSRGAVMKASTVDAVEPQQALNRAAAPDSYAGVVKIVAPAVVTVRTAGTRTSSDLPDQDFLRRFFGDQSDGTPGPTPKFRERGLGSGVIAASDGFILTNHHVIKDADVIDVDLADGRSFRAKLIGSDPPSDLALLKVDATGLPSVVLGDSDAVQVGDVVLAVGNPLGVGQTVTMGIVSAKGRSTGLGDGSYEDFLQTDAPINRGNSGGALVSTRGELIGINSQILSPSGGNIGIGFAIPANMARHVMTVLRTDGRVRRGQLGVTVQPVTSDLAAALGVKRTGGAVVTSVEPGSAAERAGLQQGDIIVSFADHAVSDANVLRNRVADARPGSRVPLVVSRDGVDHQLMAQLDEVRSPVARGDTTSADRRGSTAFGVRVAPLTPDLASQVGVPSGVRGMLVEDVGGATSAEDAGVQPGDVIQEVNRQPVLTVDELRAALKRRSHSPMLLLVNRAGHELFLSARVS